MNEIRVLSTVMDEIIKNQQTISIPLERLNLESNSPRLKEEIQRIKDLINCVEDIEADGENLVIIITKKLGE